MRQLWPEGQGQSRGQVMQFSPVLESQVPLPQPLLATQLPPGQFCPEGHWQSKGQEMQFSPMLVSQVPLPQPLMVVQVPLALEHD